MKDNIHNGFSKKEEVMRVISQFQEQVLGFVCVKAKL